MNIGELLLELLGISTDPTANIKNALTALQRRPNINFFSVDFLVSYGLAYGIGLTLSFLVTIIVLGRSVRPGQSALKAVLSLTYYGETFLVGALVLFVAKWIDTIIGFLRAGIFSLFPQDVERQLLLTMSQAGPQRSVFFQIMSGIGTGILKIEAEILSNIVLILALAFIVAYPLRHIDAAGPLMAVIRWMIVALTGTLAAMLVLVVTAMAVNISLRSNSTMQPVDLRSLTTAMIFVAAFTPFALNGYLKRSSQFQRIVGSVRVSQTVNTRTNITTPTPVYPSNRPGGGKRIEGARVGQANSEWIAGAVKNPENVLSLHPSTRPVGTAIKVTRGLTRK